MYQLSVLLPSAPRNIEKRARCIQNLRDTAFNFNAIEIVVCLDADEFHPAGTITRNGNLVFTYAAPSKYRGSFFNQAWRASTGKWLLMGNDDILFKTKNWDIMIPFDKYPDEMVVFGFKDNQYNELFFCHPVWSRKVMEMDADLFEPNYQITKCDNTIFDIHPPNRRVYLDNIELEHKQTPYGPEWKTAYDEDNAEYLKHNAQRQAVLHRIMGELMMNQKVLIGICTAEYARRADFYDHMNSMAKPLNSAVITIHGQSIAASRNKIVEQALIHDFTHVFFLDDDIIVQQDTLIKLLQHDESIVTALQLKRNYPHLPILARFEEEGIQRDQVLLDPSKQGLNAIKHAGLGAVLINTDVFRTMKAPWFRLGEIFLDQITEDVGFYRRANESGYVAFCDYEARVGHIASVVVWPDRIDGRWVTTYDTNGQGKVSTPQMYPAPETV